VMSHIRLAPTPEELHAVRIAAGAADLLLGCDMVVAASPQALSRVEHGVTQAVINSYLAPTAAFVVNPDVDFETLAMHRALKTAAGEANADFLDGTGLATALLGDSIATNLFMLGYAFQQGLVPLSLAAIERAIELNAVAVEANKRTFAWGRLAAHDRAKVEALARPVMAAEAPAKQSLAELVERRAQFLTAYQNAAYARRYRDLVATIEAVEKAKGRGLSGLAEAAARNLFKLMAYKDEYEVARLYTDGTFLAKLNQQFDGDFRLQFHLAPPLIAPRDPLTGELQKRAFSGRWMLPLFRLLAALRGLRGTAFDIFGRTAERRAERQLILDYEATLRQLIDALGPDTHALAVEIARIPEQIRGYGHIKERNIEKAKEREASLLAALRAPAPRATAAE